MCGTTKHMTMEGGYQRGALATGSDVTAAKVGQPVTEVALRVANFVSTDLFGALKDGGITILFQPQASLSDGVVGGVEALSRWDHPLHGRLSAVTLLETAASAELALAVGRHIRSRAIATAAAWTGALANLKISLNVTAADLADPEFIASLAKDLASSGLSPRRLVIEVTEEAIINDLDAAAAVGFEIGRASCRERVYVLV